jgi:ABC-type uncharacterized transport system permease subunit
MKKYLQFMRFAMKEQREYRTNFFASIATMLFNDACFMIIFIIFLWYFTNTWLTFGNFLVLCSMSCMWYGVVHWLFYNIWNLPDIIEQWKLDYHLSFPVNPLYFLITKKVWIADLWDIIFGFTCITIYAFAYANEPALLVLLKWLLIVILSALIVIWIYIIVWSVSFWMQKWSSVVELFNSMFVSFSQYPPTIYENKRVVYILMCLLLFPSLILPYKMVTWTSTFRQRLLLIWFCVLSLLLWIFVFKRWLKRYSSWNLVHQM